MRYTSALLTVSAGLLVNAAPTRIYGRAASDSEILVFKFADVLEQLETAFYTQGIAKFTDSDFTSAGFASSQLVSQQLLSIQNDESTHSKALQAALKSFGQQPVTNCQFNFDSALTDVPTMAATARIVENVGVSAYMGGATLLQDPVLLTTAASILSVEARHQTMLNVLNAGTAIPAAFDIPMTPSEILALAGPFISGCDLGIPANPSLAVSNTGAITPGTPLTFTSSALNDTTDGFFCQMMLGGAAESIPLPIDQCVVPNDVNGPVAIWITSDGQPLVNNVIDRATTQLIAGPLMTFIDTKPEAISQMLRTSGSSGSGSSSDGTSTDTSGTVITTNTISPEQASSLINSASATATPNGTDSAGAPAATGATDPTSNGASKGPTPDGPSPDGHTEVLGMSQVPKPAALADPAAASVSGSASASDSASASATSSSAAASASASA